MDYVFTLRYRLGPENADCDRLMERLAQAGCEDATLGIGQPGRIALSFARESDSAWNAMCSALREIKTAMPCAHFVEAGPDWVGLTQAAQIIGMSRQNLRKLLLAHPMESPVPVHAGHSGVWHLCDLLAWLNARGGYTIKAQELDVAQVAQQLNRARQAQELAPETFSILKALIG